VILLVSAVEKELAWWRPREGVERLVAGVGPVETACAVAAALGGRPYTLVIDAGLAGALDGAARIGDGVIVAEEMMEISLESGAPLALPDGETTIERSHSDATLVARLAQAGFAALRGVTVARATTTDETAARLAVRGAQVESMEGFAALRAAQRAGVPAIELRGISNRWGSRERSGWDFGAGTAGLRRILDAFFSLREAGA